MKASVLGRLAAEQMKAIEDVPGDGEVPVAATIVGLNTDQGPTARVRSNADPLQKLLLLNQAQTAVLAELVNQNN